MTDGTRWFALSFWESVASVSEPGEGTVRRVKVNGPGEEQNDGRALAATRSALHAFNSDRRRVSQGYLRARKSAYCKWYTRLLLFCGGTSFSGGSSTADFRRGL
ncbi:hypothetical protein JCM17478_37210 [Thermopirellula anaerolimosa]